MNSILLSMVQEFCNNATPCRIIVPFIEKERNSVFTGTIINFDEKFILFEDKYGRKVTVDANSVIRIEKINNGGAENGS